jgi:pimeloyl-ACP methyl ester carboxylesterase
MKLTARLIALIAFLFSVQVQAELPTVGIVLMHGKGGSPTKHVSDLATSLERSGFLVANLEMPWSGRRDYDVDVGAAGKEVEAALAALRQKGASKVFVAGHSQGGLFALYFGSKHHVNGIIAIAPGGNVGNSLYREKLADSVELARKLVAEGKGEEKAHLNDFEVAKGTYPVNTTPTTYLTWFEPDGAMNQTLTTKRVDADIPVLFIAPTNDYPGLLRAKDAMFGLLAKHPLTKLYEPNSSHLGAPTASFQEIKEWIGVITKQ